MFPALSRQPIPSSDQWIRLPHSSHPSGCDDVGDPPDQVCVLPTFRPANGLNRFCVIPEEVVSPDSQGQI